MIELSGVAKSFAVHNRGGAVIPGMKAATLSVARGECVPRTGRSGAGRSTLMAMVYRNCLAAEARARVVIRDVDAIAFPPGRAA